MKTMSKIKTAIAGAAVAFSSSGVSAQSYFDFTRLADTILNFTPVLTQLGALIPEFLTVVIPLIILGVVGAFLVGGAAALLCLMDICKWMPGLNGMKSSCCKRR